MAEGLLLAPNVANGETRLKLLAWADGSERWSVDIGERIGGAVSIQFNTKLPDGLFGLVVTDAAGKNRFLVHRASDGGFVRELEYWPSWPSCNPAPGPWRKSRSSWSRYDSG